MINTIKKMVKFFTRKKEVTIIKERRNNTLALYSEDGVSSPTDEIIEMPNFKFYFEVYDEEKKFIKKYSSKNHIVNRKSVIWKDPTASQFNKDFQKEYKKENPEDLGTVFSRDLAKKIVLENEYFKHYAKDYLIVLKYVNSNKTEIVEELTPDKYVPPSLGYKPKHIAFEKDSKEEAAPYVGSEPERMNLD